MLGATAHVQGRGIVAQIETVVARLRSLSVITLCVCVQWLNLESVGESYIAGWMPYMMRAV